MPCEYCGLPFVRTADVLSQSGLESMTEDVLTLNQANEHHRAHLEAQVETSYPLKSLRAAEEVNETQRITNEALGQR